MNFIESFLTALALSTDAFACAVIYGKITGTERLKNAFIIGLTFGRFQFVMPIIGFGAGSSIRTLIDTYDHWLAFTLLALVSFKMFKDAFSKEEKEKESKLNIVTLVSLGIATSLDALAVGLSAGLLQANILFTAGIIGIVCFILSASGFLIGQKLASLKRLDNWLNIFAALVLFGIGISILYEHGVFN